MSTLLLMLSCFSLSAFVSPASTGDLEQIENAVQEFVASADTRDVARMDKILHQDFRVVANRLFGAEEVSLMDKSAYLNLLKEGKIGGDSRAITIKSISIEGHNAVVQATLNGSALSFMTFIQLVKEVSGNWKVIGDMPHIVKAG